MSVWSRPLLLGLALSLIPFLWLSLGGRTFIAADSIDIEYPYLDFLRKTLFSGRPEWWDPHIAGGSPIVGSSTGRLFYPLSLFFFFAEPLDSMLWYYCLHTLIGFVGAFRYLSSHRLSGIACLLGALAYAFSAVQVQTSMNVIFYPLFAFAPWLLWCVETHASTPGPRSTLGLTVLLSLIVHGSHWQMAAIFLGTIAVYGLLISRSLRRPAFWGGLGVALGLTLLMLTPVTFSLAKLYGQGIARSIPFDADLGAANSLEPIGLAVAIYPPFYGPAEQVAKTFGMHLHEHYYGPGLALVAVAWLGLGGRKHRRWIRPWLLLAGVCFFFALGRHNPVYGWLQAHMPLFGSFRAPIRFVGMMCIPLMIVVGVGTDRWLAMRRAGRSLPAAGLALFPLFYVAFWLWGNPAWLVSHVLLVASLVVAALLWRGRGGVGALVAGAVLQAAAPWVFVAGDFIIPSAYIKQHLALLRRLPLPEPGAKVFYLPQPEITQIVGVDNIATFSPLTSTLYVRYLMTALNGRELTAREFQQAMYYNFHPLRVFFTGPIRRPESPLYDMLGSAFMITPESAQAEPRRYGRFWLARKAEVEADPAAARQRMLQASFDGHETVLLERAFPGAQPVYAVGAARLALLQPSHVVIDLNGSSGWLTLADVYYPGWTAEVDGKPRPIVRGYTTFRTLPVYQGEKQVVLRYRADELERSLPWALSGLAGLAVLTVLALWRKND